MSSCQRCSGYCARGTFEMVELQGTPTFALFKGPSAAGEKWEDGSGCLFEEALAFSVLFAATPVQEFKPKDLCEKITKAVGDVLCKGSSPFLFVDRSFQSSLTVPLPKISFSSESAPCWDRRRPFRRWMSCRQWFRAGLFQTRARYWSAHSDAPDQETLPALYPAGDVVGGAPKTGAGSQAKAEPEPGLRT